ncbi:MAG: hypothetical protein K9H64_05235 [Bacteroidales bacterium]|nr:hypothetical protein [Bacteroidales bacterium]
MTKLEQFITETDSLTSNSKAFDQIVNHIHTKRPEFKQDKLLSARENTAGILEEQLFKYYCDKTGKYKDIYNSINIKAFNSDRLAAEAFLRIIEFHACCIPDEDIAKLKNFENLDNFKNCASTTLLTENLVIEIGLGNETKDNTEISELLIEILKEKIYLKLEIGNGGPAIWTIKLVLN